MDQVRPLPIKWPCDHATVDWSAYPLQTPSGGGPAPTPYRSKTPANGTTQKGIDLSRPVTEGWVELLRNPSTLRTASDGFRKGSTHPTRYSCRSALWKRISIVANIMTRAKNARTM